MLKIIISAAIKGKPSSMFVYGVHGSMGTSETYKYFFEIHVGYNMKYVILDFFVLATHTVNAPCV